MMTIGSNEKVPCSKCGAPILLTTASKNNGLCMPCKGGYRESIEARKREIREEREADRTDPYRKLWLSLVQQVYDSSAGFDGFSNDQKLYFAVGCLEGEIYNGGFHQYFFNSSASYYGYAEEGLTAIGASQTRQLLNEAKNILFPSQPVPAAIGERRQKLQELIGSEQDGTKLSQRLSDLDTRYYLDSEEIATRMKAFARDRGLLIEVS